MRTCNIKQILDFDFYFSDRKFLYIVDGWYVNNILFDRLINLKYHQKYLVSFEYVYYILDSIIDAVVGIGCESTNVDKVLKELGVAVGLSWCTREEKDKVAYSGVSVSSPSTVLSEEAEGWWTSTSKVGCKAGEISNSDKRLSISLAWLLSFC